MIQVQLDNFDDEALHSHLLRLANAYGFQSSKQLLKAVNLKPRLSYGEQQLGQIGGEFDLSIEALTAMNPTPEACTPIRNLKHQRSGISPICSCCIKSDFYIRADWDHELVTACPQHGVLLIDTCPGCGDPITRERESITHCLGCNFSFAGADEKPAEDFDLALSALIAGAEHPARALLPKGLQFGSPPSDIAAFLIYLATHIQSRALSGRAGKEPRPKTIQESRDVLTRAWSALAQWPVGVEDFIETRIREGQGRSVHQRLGRWLAVFQKGFDRETYSFFDEVLERVLREKFDGHFERYRRRNHFDLTKDKGWYSAAEVASLLNSTASLVSAAVESGRLPGRFELIGNKIFVSIHRDVIESIRQAREAHVTQTEARKRLGASKLMLQRLVEVGALQELNKDDLPPLVSGSFRVADIDGFVCRLKDGARSQTIAPEHSVGLQDIFGKSGFLHADITAILQDISHSVLRAVAVLPDAVGLAALRFDVREMRNRLTKKKAEPLLRISDLVAYGGWKRDDIKEWIRCGLLRVLREQHGQRVIERVPLSALIEFMTQHIVLSDASTALNTETNYLLRTLKPAKIQPAVSALTGERLARGLLVKKLDVIRGAQLRKWTIRELADQFEEAEC
tara:strand:- start:4511 stop:6388 length:1878 start_codon:yes stop_codon:yes gene_type:complete